MRCAVLLLCLSLSGCSLVYTKPRGEIAGPPGEMWASLSPDARDLIRKKFTGLEPRCNTGVDLRVAGFSKSALHPLQRLFHGFVAALREFGTRRVPTPCTSEDIERPSPGQDRFLPPRVIILSAAAVPNGGASR